MAVANEAIIEKMLTELQRALKKQDYHIDMMRHISNVQLLCDLILEENTASTSELELTNEEIKKLIKDGRNKKVSSEQRTLNNSAINHNGANEGSILDF